LFENKLNEDIKNIFETKQDLESKMLISMMEKLSGRQIPDPSVLDEGIWEKAKHMLSKIRLSKSTGASEQRDQLQAAADDAANKEFSGLFAALKQAPGFDQFPNNEKEEEFLGINIGIVAMYKAVAAAHKQGLLETETANNLVSKLKGYVDGLEGDLSYSYRYVNEDDEADDKVIQEDVFGVSLKFLDKFFDAAATAGAGGKAIPKRMLRRIGRMNNKLEREIANKGWENLGPRERRAWEEMRQFRDNTSPEIVPDKIIPEDPPVDAPGGSGTPEPGAPEQDFGTSMQPQIGDPSVGIGDIGGVQDLGRLYAKAGSISTLSGWLGPGFMTSVAGFALPVAAIGAIGILVGKRLLGKSREGGLKNLSKEFVPLDPSEHESEPVGGAEDEQAPLGGEEAGRTPSDVEGEERFADMAVDLRPGEAAPSAGDIGTGQGSIGTGVAPKGSGPAAAQTQGGPMGAPDLESDPYEEDEEEKARRLASYEKMNERLVRWQKIAGIIKG
jgi:hypothetical protein